MNGQPSRGLALADLAPHSQRPRKRLISPEETVGTSILLEYHQLPTGALLWEGLVHFILRVTRMPCFFLSEACDELFNSAAGFISANARDKVARVGFWLCVRDGQRSSM